MDEDGFPKLFDERQQALKEREIQQSEYKPAVSKKEMTILEAMAVIDEHYPRIAHNLEVLWSRKECDDYIDSLIFDQRGNRAGFPKPVLEALLVVSKVHHREYKHRGAPGDKWIETFAR